ncbi:MAG: ferritin-like domain-containing protein [Proteobacteria bacterium]|nr:ferritin-like domain-containing protein [Pseudomonadota bacterium]MBI3499995.1 ferritin-like domain-containing protein [Pseudomonadota bacterium]
MTEPRLPTLMLPRRRIIGATLSATAVALLAGCAASGEGMQSALATAPKDVDLLNVALDLEYGAIAAYQLAADSKLLEPGVLQLAGGFQADHREHAALLSRTIGQLGGRPVGPKPVADYKFRTDRLTNQANILAFAAELERQAASAYLSTVPAFADRKLAAAAASILGAETMHWAILRNALGQPPLPAPFIA